MRVRRTSLIKWSLVFLILTVACGDEESRRELENVRHIAAETPLYPGFVQLRSSDVHKTSHAAIIRCYSVRANDGDIRRFYSQLFASKGWALAKEEELGGWYPEGSYELTFRKGAYAIKLGHSNLDPGSGDCNYSLTYSWNPPEPLIGLNTSELRWPYASYANRHGKFGAREPSFSFRKVVSVASAGNKTNVPRA